MAKNLRLSICGYGIRHEHRPFDLEQNLDDLADFIRLSALEKADLAILPEVAAVQNSGNSINYAEELDGLIIGRMAKEAGKRGIGVAFGQITAEKGKKYNSLILLDRRGKISAVYHKVYPTVWELERGIVPGAEALVKDTEFGRLGFAVCYDLNFAELRLAYRDQKPELVIFCSAYRGGLQTQWWAHEIRSWFAGSIIDPKSVIVNPVGRIAAETDAVLSRMTTRTINLDFGVFHYAYNCLQLNRIREKYQDGFEFEWSEPEGVMLITSTGKKTVRSLVSEMKLEEIESYLNRARKARQDFLSGKKIKPGPSAWG